MEDLPFKDGEIITGADGTKEKIVFDYDDNKKYLGWHKVPVEKKEG